MPGAADRCLTRRIAEVGNGELEVLASGMLAVEPIPVIGERRNRQLLRVLGSEQVPVVCCLLDNAAFFESQREVQVS